MILRADTESIVAFVQVVTHGSFRGAATKIGVPRSTLSERVQRLEERLGIRLLSRSTRSVQLTDAGDRYFQQVLPALHGLQSAEKALVAEKEQPAGRIRLTAPVDLGQAVLPDILHTLRTRYPALQIDAELTDRRVNLIEERFDIAVRVGPLSNSSLTRTKLGKLPALRAYASSEYLKIFGTPQEPEDLKRHSCLAMSGGRKPKVWPFLIEGQVHQVSIEPQITVNSFSVLRQLALSGKGITRLCRASGSDAASQATLVEVLADYTPMSSACYAVYQGGPNQSSALRATIEVLSERFKLAAW